VPAAMRVSRLGRTKIYDTISNKEIGSVRVGSRRLINYASLRARLTNKVGEVAHD
jgi:excisionase family DNA binding protein